MPPDAIVEVGGDDSWANLSDAAAVLRQRDLDRVLIVTDGFHEDRSLAIATNVGLRGLARPGHGVPHHGLVDGAVLRQGDPRGGARPDRRLRAAAPAGLTGRRTAGRLSGRTEHRRSIG